MSAELISKLVAAGVAPDLVAEVAMALARSGAAVEAIEQRRHADRERQARRRGGTVSRDVTLGHVTSRDVTACHATPLDKETSPEPPKEINPPTPTVDADASAVPPTGVAAAKSKRKGKGERKRAVGCRLAKDWQPPAVDALPLDMQAIVSRWPDGAYLVTAEQFRRHWHAEGRAIGAKKDWLATWCNWLLREGPEVARKQRAGFDFAAAAYALRPASAAGGGAIDAQRLREAAATYRRIGRDEDAAELERRAAFAEAGLDTS